MRYFPLLYRLNGEDRYLLWISTDYDVVAVDAKGHVLTFDDSNAIAAFAATQQYTLEREEPKRHDLDWVAKWLSIASMPVDCEKALDAWNLFIDTARSVQEADGTFGQLESQFGKVYQKLFWGNNLPSITPEGCHFDPEWSSDEITALATVLQAGMEMFQSRVG